MAGGRRRLAAVTFDAAGTLIEVAEPVGATYARFAAGHGITLDAGDVDRRFRTALEHAPPLAFPGARGATLAAHEERWWSSVVAESFGDARRHPAFERCFHALFAYYASADAWRVFPDAPPVLDELRKRGFRLAVVSNFDRRLVGLLSALGLAAAVDHVCTSAAAGAAKPDAAIFRRAAASLGVAPAAALHVGDRLREDVGGARTAGLRAMLLDRGGSPVPRPPAVRALRSLVELPALLDDPRAAPQP